MAKTPFSATKHDKSTLNSGNQYTKDDQMSIEALNYMIENGLYAVDTSERAVSISNSIVDTANNAVNIAENATNIAENATSTANSFDSQIKSAIAIANEAKEMAQDALNSSTEGVGSQVKVNGQVVGVFDADTKLDKNGTANAAIKDGDGNVIKDTYLKKSGGTLTNTLTVNAPSGKSMFYRANNDTPLMIKGGTTASFIEYQDSTGQLGYIGVSQYKNPVFNDGSNHALSMLDKNETFSGLKTFSKAPHFTSGIVRYSKASDIDISTLSTNTTNLYQYEDFVDKNNKRVGVIGSRQTVANASEGLPAGYGVYLQAGNVGSLAAMTNGSKFWAECDGDLHISGALYFD